MVDQYTNRYTNNYPTSIPMAVLLITCQTALMKIMFTTDANNFYKPTEFLMVENSNMRTTELLYKYMNL